MGLRIFGVELDGLLDELDCLFVAAGLFGENAQKVGDFNVVGILGQKPAVGLLGLGQAAGAVVVDGGLEGLVTHILKLFASPDGWQAGRGR